MADHVFLETKACRALGLYYIPFDFQLFLGGSALDISLCLHDEHQFARQKSKLDTHINN